MPRRFVLVGSGPASVSAAEAIRSADGEAHVTLVTREPEGYYSRPGLAYYLAREEPESRLFPLGKGGLARLGVETVVGDAVHLSTADRRVTLSDGRTIGYDALLLATGSQAIPLGVPGADLDGITKLDDLADARDLIARSKRASHAVIVGGGITALEIVEGLCARRVKVHYLMRKGRYWSDVLSEAESALIEHSLRERGVVIHHNCELAEIVGRSGKVRAVSTTAAEEIPCDLVAAAIGVLPRKELAEKAGLACERGVLVDESMRSSDPAVFAAGDLAETIEPRTGQRTVEVLWSSAVAKGHTAGLNMVTGGAAAYSKTVPLNVTRLGGRRITIIGTVGGGEDADMKGIARGDSETWRRLGESTTVEWANPSMHVRLALVHDVIAGALVIGDQELSFPLQDLVGANVRLGAVASQLERDGAQVPDLISDAWREWQVSRVQQNA